MTELKRSTSTRMRVIVADRDPLARSLVRRGFDACDDVCVIAETGSGTEAAELAVHYRPQVVLLAEDVRGLDGHGACRRIVENAPEVCVLLMARAPDCESELVALRAGASGLLDRDDGVAAIVQTARAACDGQLAVSPVATRALVERMRGMPEGGVGLRPVRSVLTSREWEVLDLLTLGHGTRDIADALFLTEDTVHSHVKRILRKLGVHSRADAVARAAELRQPVASAAA